MKAIINLEEFVGKTVGHRRPPSDSMAIPNARGIEDARAWQRAFGGLRISKGVYRFATHEEADKWLWQKLTRAR
jgi:hypothetical protein